MERLTLDSLQPRYAATVLCLMTTEPPILCSLWKYLITSTSRRWLKNTSRNVKNSFRVRQESLRCGIITTVKDAHVCGGDSYQGCCSTSWRLRGDRVDVQVTSRCLSTGFFGGRP